MNTLSRHNSLLGITLGEVQNQLKNNKQPGKPLGTMSVDEVLKNVWTSQSSHVSDLNVPPSASLQHQADWSLARACTGKTVDWLDVQRGCSRGRNLESSLGDTTLEDFLVQAGMYVSVSNAASIHPVKSLDSCTSIETMSDTPDQDRKRGSWDFEKSIERRLRRKIKNRESAARSRARKQAILFLSVTFWIRTLNLVNVTRGLQAYHNDLVIKVSHLEEVNMKLKKEKEFDDNVHARLSEPRYQLRRTTSF